MAASLDGYSLVLVKKGPSRVEERRGGGRLPVAMAGAFAAALQSGLPLTSHRD